MELSRKDVQEKREQLREYTSLLKEEKRKEAPAKSSDLETKEAKKRRLLYELEDVNEDVKIVMVDTEKAKKDKDAELAIASNQKKLRCFQYFMKSTGTTPKSSFEMKAGFIKSLMLALHLAGDDRVAPSLAFPLLNLFEECSQERNVGFT